MSRHDTTATLAGAAAHMRRTAKTDFVRAVADLLDEVNASHADVHADVLDAALAVARAWIEPGERP